LRQGSLVERQERVFTDTTAINREGSDLWILG